MSETRAVADSAAKPSPGRRGLASWAILAALGTVLVRLGWDRGPDVLVDFGRELYVPWRLVEGEALHRDIAWFNGPLAPWLLEGWMRVFGVSLDALQALNALVIACATWLLVLLVRRATSPMTGFVCGGTFLCVFAVAQQEVIGNFHFLSPYSHGITFGFLVGLVTLEALARGHSSSHGRWHFIAGLGAGAVFLTKAEIALAIGPASAVMLVAILVGAGSRSNLFTKLGGYCLGAALITAAAYLRLHVQLGGEGVFHALLGTWPYALDSRARNMPFYETMRGFDQPVANLMRMAYWTAGLGAYAMGVLLVGGRIATTGRRGAASAAFMVSAGAGLAALGVVPIKWLLLPLPILLVARGGALIRRAWINRRTATPTDGNDAARLAFLAFALGLLPKVLLAPMSRQYGFVLAVPGTMVAVALLIHCLPHWASRGAGLRWTGGSGLDPIRIRQRRHGMVAAGLGTAAVFCFAHLYATRARLEPKNVAVGSGADRLLSRGFRGNVMAELVRDLDERMGPEDTLLVLPEGILVNYLLRRRTSTRLVNFMPPELMFFDEEVVAAQIAENPPDFVVLVHRPTWEYGSPFMGHGYGELIMEWVRANTVELRQIENDPFEPSLKVFGASIRAPRKN